MFCFTILFFSTNQLAKLIVLALVLFNVFLYFFFFLLGKLTLFRLSMQAAAFESCFDIVTIH